MNDSMKGPVNFRARARISGFVLLLFLFPSFPHVQKYLGLLGVLAFIAIGLAVADLFFRAAAGPSVRGLSRRETFVLCSVLLAVLIAAFAVGYPLANSGRLGPGSDLDDELNSAGREILAGRNPYRLETYLGNPIDLLPGELILALPFVALGNGAFQNFFWLAAFLWAAGLVLRNPRSVLILFAAMLLFCPAVWQEFLTGSDRLTNGFHVLVSIVLLSTVTPQKIGWRGAVGAVLLGIGLASRMNFLALVPIVFAFLAERGGFRKALGLSALAALVFACVTLPFFLAGAGHFPPLTQVRVAQWVDGIWAFSSLAIPVLSILASVFFAAKRLISVRRRPERTTPDAEAAGGAGFDITFWNEACFVLAVPVFLPVILSSFASGWPMFFYAGYGVFYLPFGALALMKSLPARDLTS